MQTLLLVWHAPLLLLHPMDYPPWFKEKLQVLVTSQPMKKDTRPETGQIMIVTKGE